MSFNFESLIFIAVYMSMGVFMCKAYEDSKNIFGAVALHWLNNFISVSLLFFL